MRLFSQGKWYPLPCEPDELAKADAYTRAALDFANNWLNGNTFFLFKTSGSTGTPKSIYLNRVQMECSALGTLAALNLSNCKTFLVCLDVQFIAGAMMLVRALMGCKDIILVKPASNPFAELPLNISPDFVALVPMQLQQMLDEANLPLLARLSKLKAILLGGAPVGPELNDMAQLLDVPVFHSYGMTETVSHIALRRINGNENSPIFRALPGIRLETDHRNCLVITGTVTDNLPVVTNDIVELLPLNSFIWLGRADNVINSGGLKIQAEKVEEAIVQALRNLGNQRNLFVIGMPSTKYGQQVTAVIEGRHFDQKMLDVLKPMLLEKGLKKEEIPKQWLYVRKFSRTQTQKIDRIKTLAKLGS